MPSYGDLFLHLKDKEKIFPKDFTFEHVKNWFKRNVDHNVNVENAKCTKLSWLEKFFVTFKKQSKAIWASSGKHVYLGRNASVDFFLKKIIPVEYEDCSCSNEDAVTPMDTTEPLDTSESQCSYR